MFKHHTRPASRHKTTQKTSQKLKHSKTNLTHAITSSSTTTSRHIINDSRLQFSTEALPPIKPQNPICDPYGLDNRPLDLDTVQMQLEFVLDNRWIYDPQKTDISRTFSFSKKPLPALTSKIPGAVTGPRHGSGAPFTFLQAINNLSQNNDHYPYHIETIPRRAETIVRLKTVGRRGITHADINLACQIDSFYTIMTKENHNHDGV